MTLFSQIWHAGLTAGFVVLAVLLLRLCCRKVPRWITVALWGLVAVRLLCPVTLTSPVSVVPTLPQAVVFEAPSSDVPDEAPTVTVTEAVGGETVDESPVVIPEIPRVTLSLETVATVVWVCGIVAMTAYATISTARLRRRVKTATKLEGRIYQSEAVSSPFILGVFNPKIYLPYGLDDAVQDSVIAHETAHIKRGDHLIKPFAFLLLSVYWFQPLLWVAYICLCRDIEAACDEKAIKTLGENAKKMYSYALLTLGVQDRRRIAACPLAFGEVSVKERVKRVMSYKKPTVWILSAAIVLSSVAAVCLLTDRAPKEGEATFEGATLCVSVPSKAALDWEEPLVAGTSFTVRDHTPTPNKITIVSVNERDLTVKVRLERALYLDGKLTDTVVVPYDEVVSLTAPMYKGKTCSYLLSIVMTSTDEWMNIPYSLGGENDHFGRYNVTQYTMGEVTLRLFDEQFTMSYGQQHDYLTVGSYEDDGETLVLTEDACLTRQVFRRQEDGSLVYDAKASYRHKKAKALELANGDTLGFDFCYEISESGTGNLTRYDYTIQKADGTAWIDIQKAKTAPLITFVEDDVLCVEMRNASSVGEYEEQRYINLTTDEMSKAYSSVLSRNGQAIAELTKNKQGQWGVKISNFSIHAYSSPTEPILSDDGVFFILRNVNDISTASVNVRLDDKHVFFSYMDADGVEHIEAYVWTTGEPIKQAVIVLGRPIGTPYFSVKDNGAANYISYGSDAPPREIYTEAEQAPRKVYTVGNIRAAVYLNGAYEDLQSALKNGRITVDTLVEKLREDAKNGVTGSMMYRDGGTVVYYYGDSDVDDVMVMNTDTNHDIYIGDYDRSKVNG